MITRTVGRTGNDLKLTDSERKKQQQLYIDITFLKVNKKGSRNFYVYHFAVTNNAN